MADSSIRVNESPRTDDCNHHAWFIATIVLAVAVLILLLILAVKLRPKKKSDVERGRTPTNWPDEGLRPLALVGHTSISQGPTSSPRHGSINGRVSVATRSKRSSNRFSDISLGEVQTAKAIPMACVTPEPMVVTGPSSPRARQSYRSPVVEEVEDAELSPRQNKAVPAPTREAGIAF
ncbi:hypothetical protein SAMD00023353_3900620 [Rosellinia necatrix]|uniref:Uncharacterized protein n=1 Tax=Rosellinia necatrix TaxID=77044 RepID=A0A1S7UNM7_ROSNE|nr:hypothetical protein SAMD00023353_3900620 [Rosellinia necatrix]